MSDVASRLRSTLQGSYDIERELDGGGMARVFVATEVALSRRVVVKILPDAAAVSVERFQREVSLAARLHHPHIVPLLAAGDAGGVPYYTMPFIEGESLRVRLARQGELPVNAAVRLLREIAAALAYAHAHGVVHRDIKPDNVLLAGSPTEGGVASAMVTDFGVAKAIATARESGLASRESTGAGGPPLSDPRLPIPDSLTSLGVALGTPAYMAPEQASADPGVDHRADIYAFGVLAYELLTGQPPFTGRAPSALLAAQVTELPEPVSRRRPAVPAALATLVMCCLEKRPADRPQSANEIVHALDALVTPSAGTQPASARVASGVSGDAPRPGRRSRMRLVAIAAMAVGVAIAAWKVSRRWTAAGTAAAAPNAVVAHKIAVLPFEPLRGDTANAYLGDGMATDLTAALAGLGRLTVVPRSSAFALRGETAKQAGDKLQASDVIEGTIGRVAGRLRVTVSLVNVADETVRWSRKYDEDERNVFQLHDSIASAIATALDAGVPAAGTAAKPAPTHSIEAHDLVQRAAFLNNQNADEPSLRQAIQLAEKAVGLDPGYADAWVAIAESWFALADTYVAPREALPHLRDAITHAEAIDPRSADAHAMLGIILSAYDYDYRGAEAEFEQALALDSANTRASSGYAWQLYALGRADSALAVVRRALARNPLSTLLLSPAVPISVSLGNMDAAREFCRRYAELGPRGADCAADLLVAQRRYRDAIPIQQRILAGGNPTPRRRGLYAYTLAVAGDTAAARGVIAALETDARTRYVDGFWLAVAYAALGDRSVALDWLERSLTERSANAMTMKAEPKLAALRGDPRFEALVGRAGL